MSKEKDTAVKLKIANTEVVIGDIFEVTPKRDLDAPSGFQEYETTKLLMKGIAEHHSIVFDEEVRRWDTGFDVNDNVNRQIPKEQKQALVNLYKKHILQPYEEWYNLSGEITGNNDEFWGNYLCELYTGKKFYTDKPKDLFDLFHALKQGHVSNRGEKDSFLQRKAKYNVKNIKKSQTLKEQKAETKFEASATFMTLLDAFNPKEDDTLYTVLEWVNIANIRGADKDTVKKAVIKLFDNDKFGYDHAEKFLEAYKMTQTKSGKEQMELFSILNKLYQKRKIEYKRKQYFLNGQFLGNHLKEAASKATSNPELKDLILESYREVV